MRTERSGERRAGCGRVDRSLQALGPVRPGAAGRRLCGLGPSLALAVVFSAATAAADGAPPEPRRGAAVERDLPPTAAELAAPTRVVVLGTGTPIPDARRAGAGIAVVHRGETYLFDVGAGVVARAMQARVRHDIPSLYPSSLCCVFITHLHSDHIVDYPELATTLWWRRSRPLRAFGPPGLKGVTAGVEAMLAIDTDLRVNGSQPVPHPDFHRVDVTEIKPGIVFERDDLTVEAFPVAHGDIRPAFGYRIETPARSIVISGDTTFSETLVEKAEGVDLLFHEVVSEAALAKLPVAWQRYHGSAHSTTSQVAEVARRARPGRLVLYHALFFGEPEADVLREVRSRYDGDVVLAEDLDLY